MDISSKNRMLTMYEKYMVTVGILGQLMFYMQGFEIFLKQSAQDVSLIGFAMGFIAASSWLIYGLLIKKRVLVIANIFGVIGAIFVLLGVWIYK